MNPMTVVACLVHAMLLGGMLLIADIAGAQVAARPAASAPRTYAEIVAAAQPSDWRLLDPENTLYLELATGRVIIELAPQMAPQTVANIRTLVREGYFEGVSIIRSHDNYVVQWGIADGMPERRIIKAKEKLPPEWTRKLPIPASVPFDALPDRDGYAAEVGFVTSMPAGRNATKDEVWLTHCYGAVGVGRGNDADSGNGASLYVVTGHAPRHLDRNITVVGRVWQGMSLLSSLPRGTKPLGFYEKPGEFVPIKSLALAVDVAPATRTEIEVLRTDTPLFVRAVEALRNRSGDWFKVPAGYVELCNVNPAVRTVPILRTAGGGR